MSDAPLIPLPVVPVGQQRLRADVRAAIDARLETMRVVEVQRPSDLPYTVEDWPVEQYVTIRLELLPLFQGVLVTRDENARPGMDHADDFSQETGVLHHLEQATNPSPLSDERWLTTGAVYWDEGDLGDLYPEGTIGHYFVRLGREEDILAALADLSPISDETRQEIREQLADECGI